MQLTGKKNNKIKLIWDSVLDYIFPKLCFGCQNEGEFLCSACFDQIKLNEQTVCYLCNSDDWSDGVCPACHESSKIDKIIVASQYNQNLLGYLIEQLKFNYISDLSSVLASSLHRYINVNNKTLLGDCIVPVPLYKKRQLERGFNQSEVIARDLSVLLDISVKNDLVERTKNTAQQARLQREERFLNMNNAFVFNRTQPVPEQVILFDDVLTTGATFLEITKLLKQHGVKQVTCLALCHG
jgi:competence protein ComFC